MGDLPDVVDAVDAGDVAEGLGVGNLASGCRVRRVVGKFLILWMN